MKFALHRIERHARHLQAASLLVIDCHYPALHPGPQLQAGLGTFAKAQRQVQAFDVRTRIDPDFGFDLAELVNAHVA